LSKIRSVSDWPDHAPEVIKCAHAVKEQVEKSGLHSRRRVKQGDITNPLPVSVL